MEILEKKLVFQSHLTEQLDTAAPVIWPSQIIFEVSVIKNIDNLRAPFIFVFLSYKRIYR